MACHLEVPILHEHENMWMHNAVIIKISFPTLKCLAINCLINLTFLCGFFPFFLGVLNSSNCWLHVPGLLCLSDITCSKYCFIFALKSKMLHSTFTKRRGHEVLKPQRCICKTRVDRDRNVVARGGLQRLALGAAVMCNSGCSRVDVSKACTF